jgi:hypothetical protein
MLIESFRAHNVDGPLLLALDETFLREKVLVQNALMRKKVLRQIQLLKEQRDAIAKVLLTSDLLIEHVKLNSFVFC